MTARSPLQDDMGSGSVATTARHMADAVGYLRGVAMEAGLRRIAGKLANVRTNLLSVSAGAPEDDDLDHVERAGTLKQPSGEEDNGRRKVS